MNLFRQIMNRLSKGTYDKVPETDLEKVIAERDALRLQLDVLLAEHEDVCRAAQEMLVAKQEFVDALNKLAQENMMLRAALGTQANAIGVKN